MILEIFKQQSRPNGLNRYNLIGWRGGERGAIENYLQITFTEQERALAGQQINEFERKGLLRPTYKDMTNPGDWLVIDDMVIEPEYKILNETFSAPAHSKNGKQYKCFVILPIGEENTIERKNNMAVYDGIIKLCVDNSGFNIFCYHSELIDESGAISRQVIEALRDDDIVIADLRRSNRNVIWELGVRHALGKRSILICSEQTEHFFYTTPYRAIEYKLNGESNQDFFKRLSKQIEDIIQNPTKPDNPVTDILGHKGGVLQNPRVINKLHLSRKFKRHYSLGELSNISDQDILDLDITIASTDKVGEQSSVKAKVIHSTDNPTFAAPFNPTVIKKQETFDIVDFPRNMANVIVKGKMASSGEEYRQEFNI